MYHKKHFKQPFSCGVTSNESEDLVPVSYTPSIIQYNNTYRSDMSIAIVSCSDLCIFVSEGHPMSTMILPDASFLCNLV